jgi:ketosteroid isomerase-like protein
MICSVLGSSAANSCRPGCLRAALSGSCNCSRWLSAWTSALLTPGSNSSSSSCASESFSLRGPYFSIRTRRSLSSNTRTLYSANLDWTSTQCAKDIDRLMSHYVPEVVVFGVNPPFHTTGVAEWRRVWEAALPHFPASFGIEMRDVSIAVSGDLPLAHWEFHYTGLGADHPATKTWLRTTLLQTTRRPLADCA